MNHYTIIDEVPLSAKIRQLSAHPPPKAVVYIVAGDLAEYARTACKSILTALGECEPPFALMKKR